MKLITTTIAALLVAAGSVFAADSTKPNFVVILSDDHTYCAVGYVAAGGPGFPGVRDETATPIK